jgi:hypothetical protein
MTGAPSNPDGYRLYRPNVGGVVGMLVQQFDSDLYPLHLESAEPSVLPVSI